MSNGEIQALFSTEDGNGLLAWKYCMLFQGKQRNSVPYILESNDIKEKKIMIQIEVYIYVILDKPCMCLNKDLGYKEVTC